MLIIISVTDISYYIIPDEVLIFFSGYFVCFANIIAFKNYKQSVNRLTLRLLRVFLFVKLLPPKFTKGVLE